MYKLLFIIIVSVFYFKLHSTGDWLSLHTAVFLSPSSKNQTTTLKCRLQMRALKYIIKCFNIYWTMIIAEECYMSCNIYFIHTLFSSSQKAKCVRSSRTLTNFLNVSYSKWLHDECKTLGMDHSQFFVHKKICLTRADMTWKQKTW